MTPNADIVPPVEATATAAAGPLIFQPELRALLGDISADTLGRWWRSGKFPAPLRWPGRRLAWSRSAVTGWLEERCREGHREEEATSAGVCPV
jgi:predicted DNA-binding transcriptional regulator AlpA